MPNVTVSLFDAVKAHIESEIDVFACSKATLVHLSHSLEDIILRNNIPALMFTGFQESSHWAKETERYHQLSRVAQQVCIFAGKPLPDDQAASAVQVTLEGDDPLRQEWFVLILSQEFSVLLTGKDQVTNVEDDALRTFETILSFEEFVILRVVDRLQEVLAHYRPDLIPQLQQARAGYFPLQTNLQYVTKLTNELVQYEEWLNQRLRQERDFNQRIIESSPAYILIVDINGRIQLVNRALQQTIGVIGDDLYGTVFERIWIHPTQRDDFELLYMQAFTQPNFVHQRSWLFTKSGGERIVEWQAQRISTHSKPQVLLLGHDLTDRYRADDLLEQEDRLRAALEKELELKAISQQLMRLLAHEFRNPLSVISSASQMLEMYLDSLSADARQRRLRNIRTQVDHLADMVADLSIVLEANSGRMRRIIELQDIQFLIKKFIDDAVAGSFTERNVQFDMQWEGSSEIYLDIRLLRYIIINLVDNALKYSDINSYVRVELRKPSDSRMMIRVIDEGIGIPLADQSRVFEGFVRGSNVGERRGSGLGLQIVSSCVELYGGRLNLQSSPSGTTFEVILPIFHEPDSSTG